MAEKRTSRQPSPRNSISARKPEATSSKGATLQRIGRDGARLSQKMLRERFAAEYVIDMDAQAAYLRVCPNVTAASASVLACRLLAEVNVNAQIAAKARDIHEKLEDRAVFTIQTLMHQAFGDRRELTAVHVGCCRYCWGIDGRYQYSDGEYKDAQTESEEKTAMLLAAEKPPIEFDGKGGPGFRASRDPNPECAICAGEGQARVVIKDTREMSEASLAIFMGAKQGKHGVEIELADSQKAIEKLMRHQGLFEADNKIKVTSENVPPEVLAALNEAREKAKARRTIEMAERRLLGFTGD